MAWMQFRLRTMLAALFIVAVLLAPLVSRCQREEHAIGQLIRHGFDVKLVSAAPTWLPHRFETRHFQYAVVVRPGRWPRSGRREISWCPNYLRNAPLSRIELFFLLQEPNRERAAMIDDNSLAGIGNLADCRSVDLCQTRVTDAGLAHLASLSRIQCVLLTDTQIGDDGLQSLGRKAGLTDLMLARTKITDNGLRHLINFPALRVLHIEGTSITDGAITTLGGLKQLEHLYIGGTRISGEGARRLQRKLSGCEIYYDEIRSVGGRTADAAVAHLAD